MISQSFIPPPALRTIARGYHIRHFVLQDDRSLFKPYPARPEQSLIFFPRQSEVVEFTDDNRKLVRPPAMVMNQYTVRTNRHTANDFLVIIVELQPGILYRIGGINLRDATNTDLDANLLSREVAHAYERLNSTNDYNVMIAIIETLLSHLASRLKTGEHAVDKVAKYILTKNCNVSIDWLADHACLSSRQLERKFKERMGVGPKTYTRLARMHNSYKLKSSSTDTGWLDIALSCGYYDYQHLCKDYQEFAGCSPNELAREELSAPENMFGLSETFAD